MSQSSSFTFILVLGAVTSCSRSAPPRSGKAPTRTTVRTVSHDSHPSCQTADDLDPESFRGPNTAYVLPNTLAFSSAGDNASCYEWLNQSEFFLCSAYMYPADGLSYDPSPPQQGQTEHGPLSPEQRLELVSAAVYFAAKASSVALNGLRYDP